MIVKDLVKYVERHNLFDIPLLNFNDIDFGFAVSSDGFLVLGPQEEAGTLLSTLKELDPDSRLETAVAMKVELC